LGNANMADPLQRAAVGANAAAIALVTPFPDYNDVKYGEFIGTSNYHSMQVTLNRNLGKSLQFFLTYTFSKALGTTSVDESSGSDQVDPVDTRGRSYGILRYDRTHIFNISYNYNLPNLARGSFANWFTRGALNGWQISGITTVQSGRPIRLSFTGDIISTATLFSYFGNNINTPSGNTARTSAVAPILVRNPQTGNSKVNERYFDLSAVQIPGFGATGPYQGPFYIRSPTTNNFDVTLFKNFPIGENKKLQFRTGFFNVFNEAFPNPDNSPSDIYTQLNTVCNVNTPNPNGGIANGTGFTTQAICDPTQGFHFDSNTVNNFGKIISKHGHRRIEFALKFYF
jgi:hypothetical protein